MTAQNNRRLCVGKIATVHGVRGLLKILVFAEDAQILNGALFLSETGAETLTLTMKNALGSQGGKFWLASAEGITDRTEAEKWRGTSLWVEQSRLPPIEKNNEFYVADLAGLQVRAADGRILGTVIGIDNFGAGDLLDIQPPSGVSFYLPFVEENIVAIDIASGFVTVDLPDGLME